MENNKYYYIIGQKLKEIRLKKGLSLEELGKRVGRTKKTIQRYENGEHKLTLEIIKEITDALDYDWDSMEGYLLDTFRILNFSQL